LIINAPFSEWFGTDHEIGEAMAKPCNLLLVEDDLAVREALTKALTVEKHRVHGAANFAEAVEACTRNNIDLAIIDLNLGPEDGWDLFHHLKQHRPELPIVVTSGERGRLAHPSVHRAAGVLEKPFEFTALLGFLDIDQPRPQAPRRDWRGLKKAAAIVGGALLSVLAGSSASALTSTPLQITHLMVTNGLAIVDFQGGGPTNQVQSIDQLGSTNWVDVDAPTTSHTVTSICTAPITFYRVASFSNNTGDTVPPSTPTGLTAVPASCSQVDLSWNASTDTGANSTGVQGYYIYRNGLFLKKVQSTSYSDNGVAASTSYSYQVCAVDRARNVSPKTAAVTINTGSCGGACQYSLSSTIASMVAAGGSGAVGVTAGAGCNWTGTSGASWITVTSGATGSGTGTVGYSVVGNLSTSPRTGTLTIAGQTLTVTRDGASGAPPGPDSTPPTVSFVSPASGSSLSGSSTITVNVSDNVGVSTVQFYVDNLGAWQLLGTQIGGGANANYSQNLVTTALANGAHNLLVRGYDAAGNSAYSQLSVTVNNYNPDPGILAWAKDVGISPLSGEVQSTSVKTDSQGNQIVVGKFSGTVNFSGTTLTSQGGYDLYIAKFNPNGSLMWVRSFGGMYDNVANSVAIDSTDNVIVTGYFVGSMSFGGTTLVSGGGNSTPDMFVAKFNSSGTHVWSKRFGGAFGNYANGVAVDNNNDIFITGQFNVSVDFGGGTVTSLGGTDGFVVKYSGLTGAYVWAKGFGGLGYDISEGVAVDGSGNVLVSGYSTGSMDFGGGLRANGGGSDGFMAKFSGSNGSHVWSRMVGGLGNEDITGIAVDASGNGVLVGSFTQTIAIDGLSFSAPLSTAMLVARFDSTGRILWGKAVGGTSSIGGSIGPKAVAVDSAGNIVITGVASGEADFGNGQIGSGTGDIFIAKYNSAGGYVWQKRFGSAGWSAGLGLAIDTARNIYATGSFAGTVTFDTVQLISISPQIKDAYLVKISP
jgi:CheY-like chemotaxis protein